LVRPPKLAGAFIASLDSSLGYHGSRQVSRLAPAWREAAKRTLDQIKAACRPGLPPAQPEHDLRFIGARGLLAIVPNVGRKLPVISDLFPNHNILADHFLRCRAFGLQAEGSDLACRMELMMRRFALMIAFVFGLMASASAQKAEIDAVNAKWIEFFNKGDFAGVASLYTADATALPSSSAIVQSRMTWWAMPAISEGSPPPRCWSAVRNQFQHFDWLASLRCAG
jgi:hypothetical protein